MAALSHMLLRWIGIFVAAYATVVVLMWLAQDRLVYYPQLPGGATATPTAKKLAYEDLRITAEDGETLAAWWVPATQARGAVLLLHGNAGSIADRLDYLPPFHAMGYSVLLVDYRGYGTSSGRPSEEGTYRDARAAWQWLAARGLKAQDIVVVGESLGGAVAAELAARMQPRALLLISAFTSLPDVAAAVYPWLPVRLISRYRYDTLAHLQAYHGPVMVAHSRDDEIVPFAHGRRLHEAAGKGRHFLEMRGGHNEAFLFAQPERVRAVAAFLGRDATAATE